jgi:hypothetical protein
VACPTNVLVGFERLACQFPSGVDGDTSFVVETWCETWWSLVVHRKDSQRTVSNGNVSILQPLSIPSEIFFKFSVLLQERSSRKGNAWEFGRRTCQTARFVIFESFYYFVHFFFFHPERVMIICMAGLITSSSSCSRELLLYCNSSFLLYHACWTTAYAKQQFRKVSRLWTSCRIACGIARLLVAVCDA